MPPSFRHGHTLVEQSAAESAAIRRAFKRSAQRREHVLPPTASSSPSSPSSPPPASARDYRGEGLSPRARGWLKHLYRKEAAPHGPGTADDWSLEGGGSPHAWWDKKSGAPMNSFPRMDLHESSYGVALMARRTPAWREVYVGYETGGEEKGESGVAGQSEDGVKGGGRGEQGTGKARRVEDAEKDEGLGDDGDLEAAGGGPGARSGTEGASAVRRCRLTSA